MSKIQNRIDQISQFYDNLPAMEDLYTKSNLDYAGLAEEMIEAIRWGQEKKRRIKEMDLKSMAEFEREYELSAEYLTLKSIKYQLKGYERLLSGIKVRVDSLRASTKGQY